MASLIGAVTYLGTMMLLWKQPHFVRADEVAAPEAAEDSRGTPKASWNFRSGEADQLIIELRKERESQTLREKELNELAQRLEAERQEFSGVTQRMHRLQVEFDKNFIFVKTNEISNLKKLAKTYAVMSPDGINAIFKNLGDEQVVKVLMFLNDGERAAILDALAKLGEDDARRAARLVERFRLAAIDPREGTPAKP